MKKSILVAFVVLSMAACSPMVHRGSVAMKISDSSAHICMGKGEVSPGDKVALFRNVCDRVAPTGGKGIGYSTCTKRLISQGQVTSVLNEHYSVAKFSDGVELREGDVVEKVN